MKEESRMAKAIRYMVRFCPVSKECATDSSVCGAKDTEECRETIR